jgi:chromosome segregation ATPase
MPYVGSAAALERRLGILERQLAAFMEQSNIAQATLATDVGFLRDNVETLEASAAETDAAVAGLRAEIDGVSETTATLQADVDELVDETTTTLRADVDELRDETVPNLEEASEALHAALEAMRTRAPGQRRRARS